MNYNRIFIGTVKQCTNVYNYEKYGEKRYVGDFIIGKTEVGRLEEYTKVIKENAILIKKKENEYIWVDSLTKLTDKVLASIGISTKTIYTYPTKDNDLFVDANTLVPCLENENKEQYELQRLIKKEKIKQKSKRYFKF